MDLTKIDAYNSLLPGFQVKVKATVESFFEQAKSNGLPAYFFTRISDWYRQIGGWSMPMMGLTGGYGPDMTIEFSFLYSEQPWICSTTLSRYCAEVIRVCLEQMGYVVVTDNDLKHPFDVPGDTLIAYLDGSSFDNLYRYQLAPNGLFWRSDQRMFEMSKIVYFAPEQMLKRDMNKYYLEIEYEQQHQRYARNAQSPPRKKKKEKRRVCPCTIC